MSLRDSQQNPHRPKHLGLGKKKMTYNTDNRKENKERKRHIHRDSSVEREKERLEGT
jgi:hypothetical protein